MKMDEIPNFSRFPIVTNDKMAWVPIKILQVNIQDAVEITR